MLVGMYGLWAPQKLIGRFKTDLKLVTEAIHLPESGQPWMGNRMFSVKFRDFWTPLWGHFLWPRNVVNEPSDVKLFCFCPKWVDYDFLSTLDLDFDCPHPHKLMVEWGYFWTFDFCGFVLATLTH